jgi:hypothetical protein
MRSRQRIKSPVSCHSAVEGVSGAEALGERWPAIAGRASHHWFGFGRTVASVPVMLRLDCKCRCTCNSLDPGRG